MLFLLIVNKFYTFHFEKHTIDVNRFGDSEIDDAGHGLARIISSFGKVNRYSISIALEKAKYHLESVELNEMRETKRKIIYPGNFAF